MARKTASGVEHKTGRDEINERLQEALDGLRKDGTRVEIWATALGSFTEAVPDYRPNKKFELGQDRAAENQDPSKSVTAAGPDRKRR